MRRLILILFLIGAGLRAGAEDMVWFTDYAAAQTKADNEKKFVLLDFTGSDWNQDCMKLKSEVFDQPAFAAFADVNFVMVKVDFPRYSPQDPAQQAANNKLAAICNVTNVPAVVLANPAGRLIARTGYLEGGPLRYISELEKVPGIKQVDVSGLVNAPPDAKDSGPDTPRKPAEFVPVAPTTPTYYKELALKAISGAQGRRMALINNEDFMEGDIAKVKVQDHRVEVLCKEIREDSVLIVADGKAMELKLKSH